MQTSNRAALYIRTSSNDEEGHIQLSRLSRFTDNAELSVTSIFQDKVVSDAKGVGTNPQLQQLLHSATLGEFDLIVICSLKQFGLNVISLSRLFDQLSKQSIDLISIDDDIDTRRGNGSELFRYAKLFAENETALISERVEKSQAAARQIGRAPGRPKLSDKKLLAIKERLAKGHTVRAIAKSVGAGIGTVQRIKTTTF